jgi:hypothetical protein
LYVDRCALCADDFYSSHHKWIWVVSDPIDLECFEY